MSSSPYGNDAHCHSDGLPGDAETLEAGRAAAFDGGVRRARDSKSFFVATTQNTSLRADVL